MSRSKDKGSRISRSSAGKAGRKGPTAKSQPLSIPSDDAKEKYLVIFVAAVLLVFGAYQSIHYYGHQVVHNSDFPAFIRTGRSLLAFELPASFKRAPVLGLLQAALSRALARLAHASRLGPQPGHEGLSIQTLR